MIARRLQFDAVKYGILHPNQLGGVAQWSTEDAGMFLTHLVRAGWVKGLNLPNILGIHFFLEPVMQM